MSIKPPPLSAPPFSWTFNWYILERVSTHGAVDKQPHDSACLRSIRYTEERKSYHNDRDWLESGSGHREVDGEQVRDMVAVRWVIHIPDLMKFGDDCNERIILHRQNGWPAVIIYDDYLE